MSDHNSSVDVSTNGSREAEAQQAAEALAASVKRSRALLEERHQERIGIDNSSSDIATAQALTKDSRRENGADPAEPRRWTAQLPIASTVDWHKDKGDAAAEASNATATATLETTWRPATTAQILVHRCQEGNPLLKSIRNVTWTWGDERMLPDYVVGTTHCILFLSLKYHRLRPEYIYDRIQKLGQRYVLRILLVHVDVPDHQELIRELTNLAIRTEMTLFLAWSSEEAGRYVETLKAYEHRPPDAIRERNEEAYMARLTQCLTNIPTVNRTDVITLISHFGSLQGVIEASPEALAALPGLGEQKVRRVRAAWHQSFMASE